MAASSSSSSLGRLGFVGCGTIASSLVEGLCALPLEKRRKWLPHKLVLSPRGQSNSTRLQKAFPDLVKVVEHNQAVIDASDTVFLALTPQHAREAIEPLVFRPQQTAVSLMHGQASDTMLH